MKKLILVFPLTDEQKGEVNELFEKLINKYSNIGRNIKDDDILESYNDGICDGINICLKVLNSEINSTDCLNGIELR
jgi:hypothetical protein